MSRSEDSEATCVFSVSEEETLPLAVAAGGMRGS